jgi:hypothetical protein
MIHRTRLSNAMGSVLVCLYRMLHRAFGEFLFHTLRCINRGSASHSSLVHHSSLHYEHHRYALVKRRAQASQRTIDNRKIEGLSGIRSLEVGSLAWL